MGFNSGFKGLKTDGISIARFQASAAV